jgi:lysophospholipase L1-like esterase
MEKINTANAWIAELANDKDCYYLNTASVLVDETGYLNPEYSNGDGIHLSKLGFEKVLEYIRTHAIK